MIKLSSKAMASVSYDGTASDSIYKSNVIMNESAKQKQYTSLAIDPEFGNTNILILYNIV